MADNSNTTGETGASEGGMESVNRIAKFPIVESTVNMASGIYNKVKESHEVVNTMFTKAETTMKQAVDMSKPVTDKLETPLKKMDSILCSGLDYVESNVPAINLPPQEMYETTKNAVVNKVEPAMKSVYTIGEQGFQKVSSTVSSTFSSSQTQTSSNTQKHSCCLHKEQPCPAEET